MDELKLFIRSECINAEGPVWDEKTGTFYFVDVEAGKIFSYKDEVLTAWDAGERVGCAVPCEDGGILAGLESGIWRVDFPDGGKTFLSDPEADRPLNRFNDGKADPAGHLLAGTLTMGAAEDDPAKSALYRLDKTAEGGNEEYRAVPLVADVKLANGLAWSADRKTMYFIDTFRRNITAYPYDLASGSITGEGREVIRVPEEMGGMPDGMTIDEEGMLWVALWGGCAVTRWDPATGKLLRKIDLPALNVSSCCFGGPDMDILFITTASQDTDMEKYPLAGNVFCIKPGVRGEKSFKVKL